MDTNNVLLDPLVLDAIREKLVKLQQDVVAKEQEVERTMLAHANAQASRDQTEAARARLAAILERHAGAAPDSVVGGGASMSFVSWGDQLATTGKTLASRTLKYEVIAKTKEVLAEAGRMRSEEIYQYLVLAGVEISSQNGSRRVAQILSESDEFDPNRTLGWGLKETSEASAENEEVASK